jgi:hypothetical protein
VSGHREVLAVTVLTVVGGLLVIKGVVELIS